MKAYTNRVLAKFQAEDKKLLSDSFWNFAGSIGAQVIMFVVSLLCVRILGATEYGKWGVITSTIAVFMTFLNFGVSVTAMKHLAEYRYSNIEKASIIYSISLLAGIVFGLILFLIMFIFSGLLATSVFNSHDIEPILKITSVFLLLNATTGALSGAISGLDGYRELSISNCIVAIVGGIPIVLFTKTMGLYGIAIGYSMYYVIMNIVYAIQVTKQKRKFGIRFTTKNLIDELPLLYRYSLPAMISGAIGGPVVWVVSVVVSRMESGFAILGVYNAAKICQDMIVSIGVKLNNPLITLLSNFKSRRAVLLSNSMPYIYISLFAIPFIVFAEFFARLFFDSFYSGSGFNTVISITTLTGYIIVFKQIYGRQIITKNKVWLGVWENLIWSALLLSGVFTMSNGSEIKLSLCYLVAYFLDLMIITPMYLKNKLINAKLIYTLPSALLWLLLFCTPILCYYSVSIWYRAILYLFLLYISWRQYNIIKSI